MPENQSNNLEKASRLKELRNTLNLSQADFGKKIGVNQGNIGALENNRRPFGPNMDYKIIHAFNVNPEWWEKGDGPMLVKYSLWLPSEPSREEFINTISAQFMGAKKPPFPYIEKPIVSITSESGLLRTSFGISNKFQLTMDELKEDVHTAIVLQVEGSWMAPRIVPGSKVLAIPIPIPFKVDLVLSAGVYAVGYEIKVVNYKEVVINEELVKGREVTTVQEFVIMRLTEDILPEVDILTLVSENGESSITIRKDQILLFWRIKKTLGEEVL